MRAHSPLDSFQMPLLPTSFMEHQRQSQYRGKHAMPSIALRYNNHIHILHLHMEIRGIKLHVKLDMGLHQCAIVMEHGIALEWIAIKHSLDVPL